MLGVLNAEFYRMRKQKSTWILLAVSFVLSFISAYYMGMMFGNTPWIEQMFQNLKEIYTQNGMESMYEQVEQVRQMMKFETVYQFVSMIIGSNLLGMTLLFVLTYAAKIRLTGFYRNIAGNVDRSHLIFANLITIGVFCFANVILSLIAALPVSKLLFVDLPQGSTGELVLFTFIMGLLGTAAGMIMILMVNTGRRPQGGMFSAAVYTLFGAQVIYGLIDTVAEAISKREFLFERFSVFGGMSFLSYGNHLQYAFSIGAAVVFGTLAVVLNILALRKQDVI